MNPPEQVTEKNKAPKKIIQVIVLCSLLACIALAVIVPLYLLRGSEPVPEAAEKPEAEENVQEPEQTEEPEHTEHTWQYGYCSVCGTACEHQNHDQDAVCTECGEQRWHEYRNGVCAVCGRQWEPYTSWLPEEIYLESDEPGNTEGFEIEVPNMGSHARKLIEVYTPYTYDPGKQYDVMLFFNGLQTPYTSFTSDVKYSYRREQDKSIIMKHIWDNMMERGLCKPMIICSISTYTMDSNRRFKTSYDDTTDHYLGEGILDDYWDTAVAVRDYIYPFIIENYSTFAESSSPEDIREARHHFGIGGFSNGGYFTVYSGMRDLLDYASWFVPIAGSTGATEAGMYMQENWERYPVDLIYFGCGKQDNLAYRKTRRDYESILAKCTNLTEGETLMWDQPEEFGHDWETGSIVCFNAVQLLFSQQT